tara:strand:- start:110 stop:2149 length:2040 start_codon:yes stop_codon:yes gene_type:complete
MKRNSIILLSILVSLSAFAQSDSLLTLKVQDLQLLFASVNYTPIEFSDTNLFVLRSVAATQNSDANLYKSSYLEKKKELMKKDLGIALSGSYVENFNPDIADLNDNFVYTRKYQAGINWQILKNGLLDNKVDVKLLEDRIEREKLKNETNNQSAYYLERFDKTIFIFNKLKIELLNQREESLLKQYNLIQELVLLKKLPKEDLIRIETRLAEVQSLKNVYASYNNYLNYVDDSLDLNLKNVPLIDLDYANIFETIESQTNNIMGDNAYTNYYKWYHQIGLNSYIRYNYYDLIAANNRDYFSAGVNLSIPLPFSTKLQNEVTHEKWKYDNEKLASNRNNLHEDVLNVAYEFRYKLKQFIGFYQKRKLIEEKLRIEKVKVRLGDKNIDPMGGLDIVDDIIRVDIELLDLLQNLYLKSLKVHSKMAFSTIDDVVSNETISTVNKFSKTKNRGVYVWSKTFGMYNSGFLAEYCIYNNFNKVIVSAPLTDSFLENKIQFANFLEGKADYYLMLGSNKLFYHDSIEGYIEKVKIKYKAINVQGIHLDIEPHTFENWKTDRMKLLNQYVELVGKVSTYCKENDLKLEISIPLHYNIEIIDKLFPLVDKVYFMSYENVKNEYIHRKVQNYVDSNLDKIEIALRTEDFNNRIEMEKKIDTLSSISNIQNYTYHDLTRLIKLDKDNLSK